MISPNAIADVLGIEAHVQTMDQLEGAVSSGLSKQSVLRMLVRVTGNPAEARIVRDRVVPPATWKRTKGRLSVHASERAERLARVFAAAQYTWDDSTQARAWMAHPHPELAGRTPIEAAATELGARNVENLLDKLFYGIPA